MPSTVAWVVITTDNLYPYLVAGQVAALRTAALSASSPVQGDPFIDIMPQQANRVRTAIASNPKNQLSLTANSVPPECVSVLIWLVLEAMQGRIVGLKLTEEQKKQIADAKQTLDDIRTWTTKKWWLVSAPNDPDPSPAQQAGPTAAAVQSNDRLMTRDILQGL